MFSATRCYELRSRESQERLGFTPRIFKEVTMTRLPKISRTTWVSLAGAAGLTVAAFLACGGPAPVSGSTSLTGTRVRTGTETEVGTGASNPINLKPNATSTNTSVAEPELSAADGGNCGVSTSNLTKQPADLLLILDRSTSMTRAMDSSNECAATATNCKERWATIVSGLNGVLSGSAGNVNWGLKLYASAANCGVTTAMDVNIFSANAATTIQQLIAQATHISGTPTRAAVNAGVAYLKTLTSPESKYILLATDGEPNCANGATSGSDVPGTVTAISAAAAAGFKTYVLGVGPETGNLDNFAAAGGTSKYYPALSPDDLTKALAAIVGAVASCTFNLSTAPPVPTNVVIEFDDNKSLRAPRDTTHTDGWDYTSSANTTIQLFGSWCENVTNGVYKSAKVLMGCPFSPIP
jgi:hypothetical protein